MIRLGGTTRAVKAATVYFAAVFLCAFVLGAIRVLLVAPHLGDTAGVMLETPIILAISWAVCRRCIERFNVGSTIRHRLIMGSVALILLQGAEFCIAIALFGRTATDYVAAFATAPGAIGLAAQVGFAILPAVVAMRPSGVQA